VNRRKEQEMKLRQALLQQAKQQRLARRGDMQIKI